MTTTQGTSEGAGFPKPFWVLASNAALLKKLDNGELTIDEVMIMTDRTKTQVQGALSNWRSKHNWKGKPVKGNGEVTPMKFVDQTKPVEVINKRQRDFAQRASVYKWTLHKDGTLDLVLRLPLKTMEYLAIFRRVKPEELLRL